MTQELCTVTMIHPHVVDVEIVGSLDRGLEAGVVVGLRTEHHHGPKRVHQLLVILPIYYRVSVIYEVYIEGWECSFDFHLFEQNTRISDTTVRTTAQLQ